MIAHEPFHARNPDSTKKVLDWPRYQDINTIRANYGALVAMCDDYFGQLLDRFDEYNDGFLLSEHDWWGK